MKTGKFENTLVNSLTEAEMKSINGGGFGSWSGIIPPPPPDPINSPLQVEAMGVLPLVK